MTIFSFCHEDTGDTEKKVFSVLSEADLILPQG
jgi:hypothetical protein